MGGPPRNLNPALSITCTEVIKMAKTRGVSRGTIHGEVNYENLIKARAAIWEMRHGVKVEITFKKPEAQAQTQAAQAK